jgi:hypothetical protein
MPGMSGVPGVLPNAMAAAPVAHAMPPMGGFPGPPPAGLPGAPAAAPAPGMMMGGGVVSDPLATPVPTPFIGVNGMVNGAVLADDTEYREVRVGVTDRV